MAKVKETTADYGNWVSTRFVLVPAAVGVIVAAFSVVSLYLLIPAALFILVACYFVYARWMFSPKGRNLQKRIRALLLARIAWEGDGTVLDIGCGSGALTIELAKQFPSAKVIGTDYWGGAWGYSQSLCAANALAEKVDDRVSFEKASAPALPFPHGEFDAVVSNLVFHEVRDVRDKRDCIREALRVLRPGGKFAFRDLFFIRQYYGSPEELIQKIKEYGVSRIELVPTKDSAFIPVLLKLPFMVGTMGLIVGEK